MPGSAAPQSALDHNYPILNRAFDAAYPPGSIFKPLTAIAALQEEILNPVRARAVHRHVRRAGGHAASTSGTTGTRTSTRGCSSRRRSRTRATRTSTASATRSTSCRPTAASPCSAGRRVRLRQADRRSRAARRRAAFSRRSPGSTAITRVRPTRTTGRSTASGSRATRSSSRLGRETSRSTPLQMARFYSAIANGGKLVQPHLAARRREPEQDARSDAGARRAAPDPRAKPGGAARRAGGAASRARTSFGTSYGVFGNFPVPIAGKTGTAQKVVTLPGDPRTRSREPVVVVRLRPVQHSRRSSCAR